MFPAQSQVNVKDSLLRFTMVSAHLGINSPSLDLRDRFGMFASTGLDLNRKTKSGWIFGASGRFHFGERVRELDMLQHITVGDGFVIGSDGTLSDVRYHMRGFQGNIHIGKIFPIWGPNKNSGPFVLLGTGFLQHKIRFETDRGTDVPALSKDYKKGYDRMSNGWLISPALGYHYFGNNRMLNFFVQVEYTYAATAGRRSWDFNTEMPYNEKRKDAYMGIRVGWTLPIYKNAAADFFYF